MLKTVSSITNAIGALNYKGTWNASTNSPTLASGVGTKGDYYVVSVAGSTNLDGETLWGVGDWAVYNGSAWQKVEGGNTINATTVSASTSVTTPVIQATSSAGGTLKNNGGTAQLQWGSGGGSNLSLEVATNINPANAAVAISPTGTGTVAISPAGALTINPTTASTMNNVAIGGTTALAGTFTALTSTGNTILGDASTDTLNVGNGGLVKDASGNVLMGTASATVGGTNYGTLALAGGRLVVNRNVDGSDSVLQVFGTAGALYVQGNGNCLNTNNSYGALSDIKLKENIVDTSPKLAQLNQVRIVNYNLIGDSNKQLGVIAQELEQVFPSMVDEATDRDAEGNDIGTTTKSVKYSVFVPILIKALQEQQEMINNLTSRIDALKG
jgi:hypothetical protein